MHYYAESAETLWPGSTKNIEVCNFLCLIDSLFMDAFGKHLLMFRWQKVRGLFTRLEMR